MDSFDANIEQLTKSLEELDKLSLKHVLEQRKAQQQTPSPRIIGKATPPSQPPPLPLETPAAERLEFSSPYYAAAPFQAEDSFASRSYARYSPRLGQEEEEEDAYHRYYYYSHPPRYSNYNTAETYVTDDPLDHFPVYTDYAAAAGPHTHQPKQQQQQHAASRIGLLDRRRPTEPSHNNNNKPPIDQPSSNAQQNNPKSPLLDDSKSRASTITWQQQHEFDNEHYQDPEKRISLLLHLLKSMQDTLERQETLIARLQQENMQLRRSSSSSSSRGSYATTNGFTHSQQQQQQQQPPNHSFVARNIGDTTTTTTTTNSSGTPVTPGTKLVAELSQLMGIDPGYQAPLSIILDKHWGEVERIRRRHGWNNHPP